MKLAAIISTLGALFLFSTPGAQAKKSSSVKEMCGSEIKRVVKHRMNTWRAEDQLQISHTLAGYRAGHRTRSCRNVYQHLRNWATRAKHRSAEVRYFNTNIRAAIMWAFGSDVGPGAIVVANCETGELLDNPSAALVAGVGHHQYTGIFQMGDGERATYANFKGVYRYNTVIDQVKAAARMQADEGWGPWQCRPEGGLRW